MLLMWSQCNSPTAHQPNDSQAQTNGNQTARLQEADKLVRSIQQNDLATVERLLSAGANPNEKGTATSTPLMMAVLKQNKRIIEMLLNADANINATDDIGDTALVLALKSDAEIVDLLLKRGADVSVRDKFGSTVLHDAARESDADTMRRLLAGKVDPNLKDNEGNTPLMIQVGLFHEKVFYGPGRTGSMNTS